MNVPLAEHFHSLQGEGAYSGLPMHFLRFPGCSVGRPASSVIPSGRLPILPTGAAAVQCHAFDGTPFWCDTDFSKKEEVSVEQLVAETFETTACFSGGEPLIHQDKDWYQALLEAFSEADKNVHIETSGTIFPKHEYDFLTVSPKQGWLADTLNLADQIKILVTKDTRIADIDEISDCANGICEMFLSPVFDPNSLVQENVERCMYLLQHDYPRWRMSVQMHKFVGLR